MLSNTEIALQVKRGYRGVINFVSIAARGKEQSEQCDKNDFFHKDVFCLREVNDFSDINLQKYKYF